MGRGGTVARHCALRHRDFVDRHNRLAGGTVQHVDAALLGRRHHRLLDAGFGLDVDQRRLAAYVHVPQVVVGELEGPLHVAGVDVQGGQASGIFFGIVGTVAAVLVGHLVAHRQVEHAEFFIDAEHGPHVRRVAGVGLALGQRGGVVRVAAVPVPHQFAGVHVERADHTAWLVDGNVVGHVTADHDQVLGHGRWRGGVVTTWGEAADVGTQVDLAFVTEVFAHLAGVGVQGDQTGVGSRDEDAFRAGVRRSSRAGAAGRALLGSVGSVIVIRHATAGHVCPTLEVFSTLGGDLRVETPDFLAGVRVQGNHLAVRCAHVKHAIDFQRGVFRGGFTGVACARNVAGTEGPRRHQLMRVFRGDLRQWRVTITVGRTAIGVPVTIGLGRRSVGHARHRVAVQLAGLDHFTWVGELAGQGGSTGQHHGNAQRASAQRRGLATQQRTTKPRQQHDDAQGKQQGQARYQLPPVQADFPQCPHGAGEQHQCIQAQRGAAGSQQQHAGQGDADTRQQVVQRPAEHAQLDAASQQGQPHDQQQDPQQPGQQAAWA